MLVDVAPDGTMTTIARGFLNIDYRDGLADGQARRPAVGPRARAVPAAGRDRRAAGHRIGLLVQSSNTVWAVPGQLGTNNILTGPLAGVATTGSSLELPLAAP